MSCPINSFYQDYEDRNFSFLPDSVTKTSINSHSGINSCIIKAPNYGIRDEWHYKDYSEQVDEERKMKKAKSPMWPDEAANPFNKKVRLLQPDPLKKMNDPEYWNVLDKFGKPKDIPEDELHPQLLNAMQKLEDKKWKYKEVSNKVLLGLKKIDCARRELTNLSILLQPVKEDALKKAIGISNKLHSDWLKAKKEYQWAQSVLEEIQKQVKEEECLCASNAGGKIVEPFGQSTSTIPTIFCIALAMIILYFLIIR